MSALEEEGMARRQAFPAIQEVLAHVVEVLKQRDGSQPLNMSHVLGGLSLDILGPRPALLLPSHFPFC